MTVKITYEDQTWDLEELIASHPKGKPLTPDGRELLDPTPMAPPVGYKRQPSLSEQIREMVRSERLAADLDGLGFETLEEADDFDVGDDFDPSSPYEEVFDPTPISELRRRQAEDQDVKKEAPATPPKKTKAPNPPEGAESQDNAAPEGGSAD